MSIFTLGIICAVGCFVLEAMDSDKKTNESNDSKLVNKEFSLLRQENHERPKDFRDCDYDYVRDNLRRGYYDNGECYDIARRLRTDAWFRHSVERSMDYGRSFDRAIEDAIEEHGEE